MVDYRDPLIRAVYGFAPILPSLHMLELDGVRRYLVMTERQCEELRVAEPGTVCIPLALPARKRARSRIRLEKEVHEEENEEDTGER